MALSVVGLSTVLLIENANTGAIAPALSVLTHSFLVERSGLSVYALAVKCPSTNKFSSFQFDGINCLKNCQREIVPGENRSGLVRMHKYSAFKEKNFFFCQKSCTDRDTGWAKSSCPPTIFNETSKCKKELNRISFELKLNEFY